MGIPNGIRIQTIYFSLKNASLSVAHGCDPVELKKLKSQGGAPHERQKAWPA